MELLVNAVLLAAVVFALTDAFKRAVPGVLPPLAVQLSAFVIGIGSTFLVAASQFGSQQVIMKLPLDKMDNWTKIVVGVLIGAGATLLDRFSFVGSRSQDPTN